jgi:hypothetical protein
MGPSLRRQRTAESGNETAVRVRPLWRHSGTLAHRNGTSPVGLSNRTTIRA